MSAKELGQIHTVTDTATPLGAIISPPTVFRRYDLAGGLSDKLQRLVRQGNYFKLVGIDMSLSTPGATNQPITISGFFRYYTPTKGRCAAFRHAFKAAADQMNMQGIPMRTNAQYDFRVALTDESDGKPVLANRSTLDGTNGLALQNTGIPGASVFDVYNKSVLPTLEDTPANDLFDEGFDTLLQSGGAKTDFVLNETRLFSGNEDFADLSFETIPFQVSIDSGGTGTASTTTTFQWRPDPALYVAVMTGNLEMVLEEVDIGDGALGQIDVAFYISGWKSIMGNPDKKKKSRRSSKKKV